MAKGLTKRQDEILQYILTYVQTEGFPPSIREIGKGFDIGSLRGVTVHLDALERKGYINRSNTPRSIKVIHPSFQPVSNVVMLPLLGNIAAGEPIFADNHENDILPVPAALVRYPDESFLLKVKGDSMIGEGINEDDILIIRKQETAKHLELVAVRLENEATVKRYSIEKNGRVQLMPSNPSYAPIPVETEHSGVIGKVVGLLRSYDGHFA